jgi:hypothetical protein
MVTKFVSYGSYVMCHKWFVFLECAKRGMPIIGLLHDMSKFRPSEFIPYMDHFGTNIRKGRNKTGYYKPEDTGNPKFERAWLNHQHRNPHHWQYWVIPNNEGGKVYEIPLRYRKEMFCDWLGAGRAQGTPDVRKWWETNKDKMKFGTETYRWIEHQLAKLYSVDAGPCTDFSAE